MAGGGDCPCLGWDVHIEWTDVYDGVGDKITFDGVISEVPQDQPGGEGVYMTGTGTASGSRAAWKACNPGIDVTPSGTVSATFQAIVTRDTITVSAFADFATVLAGVSTGYFETDANGGTVNVEPGPAVGDPCPHFSYGTATITPYEAPE